MLEITMVKDKEWVKNGKKWDRRRPKTSLFVLIFPPVFEVQGFEISKKKTPHTPSFGEIRFPAIKEKKNVI